MPSIRQILAWVACAAVCVGTGCGNAEWNWDTSWWKQERRVVRPADRTDRSARSSDGKADGRSSPTANSTSSDSAAPSRTNDDREANRTSPQPSAPESASPGRERVTPVSAAPERMRPFQHLYLLPAGREASESTRNEARVVLKHLEPRLCGMMIEMLYVPLGRSGSGDETYLIYEQPEEFERAMAWALRLDCAPDSADAGSSWCAAMRSFAELLLQGAVVDRVLQDRCERQLTAVLESQGAASDERWAAGIFGGRLVADYRYDYIGARRLYAQARQLAKDESIEAMTADWWRADTFVQEGRSREAGEAYEDLLDGYTHLWPRSQIIARAYANMKKGKKR